MSWTEPSKDRDGRLDRALDEVISLLQRDDLRPGERSRELTSAIEAWKAHRSAPPESESTARASFTRRSELVPAAEIPVPESVGAYCVEGVLGVGGMGVVYRAVQAHPRRVVALKMIRPGLVDDSALRRFEREAALLARVNHPGIAQIYEAGWVDGASGTQPFIAMELVDGHSLLDYATAEQLTTRARLDLVARVCDAIDHAHERGVVHRDLKPSNILVGRDGQPKVVDFGVARATALDAFGSGLTRSSHLVGTVAYMSPEQALGTADDIDARSDVYSLGVLLYELLSGRLPYELAQKSVYESLRSIQDDDPTPLSAVAPALRGEIELIVAKALEKEREQRYPSAAEFAADLRRLLADQPIVARPSSALYQLAKFARRQRRLVAAVALAFVILLAGVIATTTLAFREGQARLTAQAHADRADRIKNFLLDVLQPRDAEHQGQGFEGIVELLDRARERVRTELAQEPDVALEVNEVLGQFYATLNVHETAAPLLEATVAARRRDSADAPEKLLGPLMSLAYSYQELRQYDRARAMLEEYVQLAVRVHGAQDRELQDVRAKLRLLDGLTGELDRSVDELRALELEAPTLGSLHFLATALYRDGRYAESEARLRNSIAESDNADHNQAVWNRFWLTFLLCDTGRYREAELCSVEMLERARQLPSEFRTTLAFAMYLRAHVRCAWGDYASAEHLSRQSLATLRSLRAPATFPYRELGAALAGQGQIVDAVQEYSEYYERQQRTDDADWYVAQAAALLAEMRGIRGELQTAVDLGRDAVERMRCAVRPGHPRIAEALEPWARTLVRARQFDQAREACCEALQIRESCMDAHAAPVASLRLLIAEVDLAQGRAEQARAVCRSVLVDFRSAFGDGHPSLAAALHVLARCQRALGDPVEAEATLTEAIELRRGLLAPDHPDTAESLAEFGRLLADAGRTEGATEALREALAIQQRALGAAHPVVQDTRAALLAIAPSRAADR